MVVFIIEGGQMVDVMVDTKMVFVAMILNVAELEVRLPGIKVVGESKSPNVNN